MSATLVTARALLVDATTFVEGGGLLVEAGTVRKVLTSPAAVARSKSRTQRVLELGDALLAPGFVNAHAHLELGALAGRTPRGAEFGAWVREVLAEKAKLRRVDFERAVASGADASLRSGVTSLADIDSTDAARRGLRGAALRVWSMRELLDAYDPARTPLALARVRRALPTSARRREGLSPHAPFTASPALLAQVAVLARKRRAPVAIHWSESAAEEAWLRDGAGPLAALLGPSPRRSGLDLLAQAGLLSAPLALVHGNFPARGEPQRIARAGAVVVHCPGSHAWFERAPFPWRTYLRAGVRLALGTDSLASNESLDLRREMQLARRSAPWLAPEQVFAMATDAGAAALGMQGRIGTLQVGASADFVAHAICGARGPVLEALTHGVVAIAGVWIGGRAVALRGELERGTPARRDRASRSRTAR
jgi:cytosine/adenosine deaminase-related metal-dependent hydrolase